MRLDNVLFVGAHADDIELFAGALLSKLCHEGRAVNCITFSSHRGISDHKAARDEHVHNMRSLGLKDMDFLLQDFEACNGHFQAGRDSIYKTLQRTIDARGIQVIVTHPEDTNQDHQQVRAEVLRVAKGKCSILSGEFPFNQVAGRVPDLFVPVANVDVGTKVSMINNYKSQQLPGRNYFRTDVWTGLAAVRGAMIGTDYAEGFFVERIVCD